MEEIICSQCGSKTEWDYDLGDEPLCSKCWDKQVEGKASRYFREYYEANREKVLAKQKLHREAMNAVSKV